MIYISVGAALAVLLLGAAIFIWCYCRRRKKEVYGFVQFYVLTAYKKGAHDPERAAFMRFCDGVFTDQFIFRKVLGEC